MLLLSILTYTIILIQPMTHHIFCFKKESKIQRVRWLLTGHTYNMYKNQCFNSSLTSKLMVLIIM